MEDQSLDATVLNRVEERASVQTSEVCGGR